MPLLFLVGGTIPDPEYDRNEKLFDKDIDRKEKLVQTYLVMYSLFLAGGQIDNTQRFTFGCLAGFIIFILFYYIILSSITYSPSIYSSSIAFGANISAFISAIFFSFSVLLFISRTNHLIMEYESFKFIFLIGGPVFLSLALMTSGLKRAMGSAYFIIFAISCVIYDFLL